MVLIDVNVLLYAHREDTAKHGECRAWLEALAGSGEAFGISDLVLSSVLRIATHPRVFSPPTPLDRAIEFCEAIRNLPGCVIISPGARHWQIFLRLCRAAEARGNLVPDAYLSALAQEIGCVLVTTDRDFSRFPGVRWNPPQIELD